MTANNFKVLCVLALKCFASLSMNFGYLQAIWLSFLKVISITIFGDMHGYNLVPLANGVVMIVILFNV